MKAFDISNISKYSQQMCGGCAGGLYKRFRRAPPASLCRIFAVVFTVLTLTSCIGAAADISIRADGSGRIPLEYRVAQMLESMGRLDGNERWPVIAIGKADFERAAARIPGLRLRSFSAKEVRGADGGKDLVTKAALDFENTGALLSFLDITAGHVSLSRDKNGNNLLRLVMLDPSSSIDNTDLISLLREISAGYEIRISLSAPKNADLSVIPPSVPASQLVSHGKKVTFAIASGELVDLKDGLALEISW